MALVELHTRGSGGGGFEAVLPGYGEYGGGDGRRRRRAANAKLALWIALGSITLFFSTLLIAYAVVVSGGEGMPVHAPPLLFLNTAILASSSFSMERARRGFESWRPLAFRRWLLVTEALGVAFLGGQVVLWQQLAGERALLLGRAHGSFFYLLSGLHAVHLAAGIVVLLYVLSARLRLLPGESATPGLAATYWHFMDGLWMALVILLFWF
jgi:cytochrome c oxidase subunit 3